MGFGFWVLAMIYEIRARIRVKSQVSKLEASHYYYFLELTPVPGTLTKGKTPIPNENENAWECEHRIGLQPGTKNN